MEKLGGNLLNFDAKHQIFKFKWKFLSQDSFFVTHSLRKSFSMSLNWLTNLRPLLIALVEVLQVLDLDPVLQRGEVKVAAQEQFLRERLLRLQLGGGEAASVGGEYAHFPWLVTNIWSQDNTILVTGHKSWLF